MSTQAKKLRQLLNQPGIVRAPGAYDAWSARLIEMAGFPAIYMTGYGVSASTLGKPDIGLISAFEMTNAARNICNAVNIPVIADADTGFGGSLNVVRTVQEYEQAGVAAIQLEDQVFPKRCGHMEGKQVMPKEDMVAKVRAAVYARRSDDFVIIARTDARAVNGFDDAMDRALAYAAAGADVIFFEAPQSVEEMEKVTRTVGRPCLANMVEKGKTPFLTGEELAKMGFKIAIYPASALYAATRSVQRMLGRLKADDTTANYQADMAEFPEFNELVGVPQARALEKSFSK